MNIFTLFRNLKSHPFDTFLFAHQAATLHEENIKAEHNEQDKSHRGNYNSRFS